MPRKLNILAVNPFGIGDALFMTPLLRALHEQGAAERIDLLLGSRTRVLFEGNPRVTECFEIDKGAWHREGVWRALRDSLRVYGRLRKTRYDVLLDFSLTREYAFWAAAALGIRTRVGFEWNGRGNFLTHRIELPAGFSGKHAIEWYAQAGDLIGVKAGDLSLEVFASDEARDETARFMSRYGLANGGSFLALCPGGGESWGRDARFKRWPAHKMGDVARWILTRLNLDRAVILGSRGEWELGDTVGKTIGQAAVNGCGELSLLAAAALIERAGILVSNDGGLLHLAKAVRTPTLSFFGPVDDAVYGPYPRTPLDWVIVKEGLACRPCYVNFRYTSDCPDRACLQLLEPQDVIEQLEKREFVPRLARHMEQRATAVKA